MPCLKPSGILKKFDDVSSNPVVKRSPCLRTAVDVLRLNFMYGLVSEKEASTKLDAVGKRTGNAAKCGGMNANRGLIEGIMKDVFEMNQQPKDWTEEMKKIPDHYWGFGTQSTTRVKPDLAVLDMTIR